MIFTDSLPKFKRFMRHASLDLFNLIMLTRLVCAFLEHRAAMSATAASCVIRSETRHRAQLTRWLASWSNRWGTLRSLAKVLLRFDRSDGRWIFCIDSTHVSHQGKSVENSFSRGNTKKRPKKSNRKQLQTHRHSCHCFVMGLLISPDGIRIPYCLSFYTRSYCQHHRIKYRTQAELAAVLIGQVEVPKNVEVMVLGDTAFEANSVRKACRARGFDWLTPLNPQRVLAGLDPRPKVRSLIEDLNEEDYATIRLFPHRDAQRRLSPTRSALKKQREYLFSSTAKVVHSVGKVRLVFSRTKTKNPSGNPSEVKILISNRVDLSGRELVHLYALRWQVELFFKELKSDLGLGDYRLRNFKAIEAWVEACLITFTYLEWYRCQEMASAKGSSAAEQKRQRWLKGQRVSGLRLSVMHRAELTELRKISEYAKTRTGQKKLRRALREALPSESRNAA